MSDKQDKGSSSFFYRDEHGRKSDHGLHDDEPADPHGLAEMNIKDAMARGMSREAAERDYGHRSEEVQPRPLSEIMPRG